MFPRIKPLGWAMFEVLTSAQMNQLDIDHAKAADGSYVQNYGAGLSFTLGIPAGTWTRNDALIYCPPANQWVGADDGGASVTAGGTSQSEATVYPGGLAPLTGIAFDGSNVLLVAGPPASGSHQDKIRRTTLSGSGFLVWTSQNTAAAASTTSLMLDYFPSAGLFISGSSSGLIETSPDGATWTARTNPDFFFRQQVACSGVIAVMVNKSATNQYLTSTNGITWTARTFPIASAVGWMGVAYSQVEGVFMAISREGFVLISANGTTWTQIAPAYSKALYPLDSDFASSQVIETKLVVVGNMWVTMKLGTPSSALICSIDQGASWRPLLNTNQTSNPKLLAAGFGQIGTVDGDGLKLSNQLTL